MKTLCFRGLTQVLCPQISGILQSIPLPFMPPATHSPAPGALQEPAQKQGNKDGALARASPTEANGNISGDLNESRVLRSTPCWSQRTAWAVGDSQQDPGMPASLPATQPCELGKGQTRGCLLVPLAVSSCWLILNAKGLRGSPAGEWHNL